jgi:hypothetical protein
MSNTWFAAIAAMVAVGFAGCAATADVREAAAAHYAAAHTQAPR